MTTTKANMLRSRLIQILGERSVKSGNFTLSSGKKSRYYVDARRTTMSAEGLEVIGALSLMAIRDNGWAPVQVGGLTLGADPVAYAIARSSREHPPMVDAFTVRKEPKSHGTSQVIEGCFTAGARTVVVEDVLTTGASALRAAVAVRAAGGVLDGVVAIVDREEGGAALLASEGIRLLCLISIRELGVDLTPA